MIRRDSFSLYCSRYEKNHNIIFDVHQWKFIHVLDGISIPIVYIHGAPGCGKSFIAQLFLTYASLSYCIVHYHCFIDYMYKSLSSACKDISHFSFFKNKKNILSSLYCHNFLYIDEFFIENVSDISAIKKFFSIIISYKIRIIITSNFSLQKSYKGYFSHQENFYAFLQYMEKKSYSFCLESSIDYRIQKVSSLKSYFLYPVNKLSENVFRRQYIYDISSQVKITLLHHDIFYSSLDFLDISLYKSSRIFLKGVTPFHFDSRDAFLRFVSFIDIICFYGVLCSFLSYCSPEDICGENHFYYSFFPRILSRIRSFHVIQY